MPARKAGAAPTASMVTFVPEHASNKYSKVNLKNPAIIANHTTCSSIRATRESLVTGIQGRAREQPYFFSQAPLFSNKYYQIVVNNLIFYTKLDMKLNS
jgi:hypothetical protein